MKRLANVVGFSLICLAVCLVAWPAPLFTLNEPWLTKYVHLIYWLNGVPVDAVGVGTAFVFLWFFMTMPAGLAAMAGGVGLIHWGRDHDRRTA